MDTKVPLNFAFDKNHYLYVIVQHFSSYFYTVSTPKNVHYAVTSINHNWISKFGQPHCLITKRGTK